MAQEPDRFINTVPADSRNGPAEEMPAVSDNLPESGLTATVERIDPSKSSPNAMPIAPPRDVTVQVANLVPSGDQSAVFTPGVYSHPQFYYNAYENNTGDWSQYVTPDSVELNSPGGYNDNQSLLFHGYGYNQQMPYGPYSPATTPTIGRDGQIFSPQQYPFSVAPAYYHQTQYITSPTPISQTEPSRPVRSNHQGDTSLFGPRPSYPPNLETSRKGSSSAGNSSSSSYYDSCQSYDGFGSVASWTDWSKSLDGQRPFTPISPAVSPQPMNTLGSFGRNMGMASQQHRPSYTYGSGTSSYNRGYQQNGVYQNSSFGRVPVTSYALNDRWLTIDKARRRGRDTSSSLCSCNGTLDILSEQNRGPRASKPKAQGTAELTSATEISTGVTPTVDSKNELYNREDFVIERKDAKFFIIKSYSEDNVHKSVKYGVWASTPNGNKKLDAAYREATEKQEACPVFLLFSVNASAQFCGVAEMVGPVDFDRSVDYWQQDKWNGQFSVKWHIVKDVPNSHFRHIIMENNDNKPVTNSRDTQEVKLEQGLEMLKIFKTYDSDTSILDDFEYYEERQKVMQERKARQQATLISASASAAAAPVLNDPRVHITVPGNVNNVSNMMKQMSKSFAEAVRLDENTNNKNISKEDTSSDKLGSEQQHKS